MRVSRILLPALALLSAGLLTGATLSIGATADRVEVWKTDLYGQAAALEGLEVTLPAEAERQLSDRLGRACHIAHGRKKGRVEIEYYGVDDLNNLLEALGRLGK